METIINDIQININEFVDQIKIQLEDYVTDLAVKFADSLKKQIFDGLQDELAKLDQNPQQTKPENLTQRPNPIQTTNFNLLRAEIQDLRQRMKEIGEVNARALIEVSQELEKNKPSNAQSKQFKELDQRIRQLEWKIDEIRRK